jgi:hypothetical protein
VLKSTRYGVTAKIRCVQPEIEGSNVGAFVYLVVEYPEDPEERSNCSRRNAYRVLTMVTRGEHLAAGELFGLLLKARYPLLYPNSLILDYPAPFPTSWFPDLKVWHIISWCFQQVP